MFSAYSFFIISIPPKCLISASIYGFVIFKFDLICRITLKFLKTLLIIISLTDFCVVNICFLLYELLRISVTSLRYSAVILFPAVFYNDVGQHFRVGVVNGQLLFVESLILATCLFLIRLEEDQVFTVIRSFDEDLVDMLFVKGNLFF